MGQYDSEIAQLEMMMSILLNKNQLYHDECRQKEMKRSMYEANVMKEMYNMRKCLDKLRDHVMLPEVQNDGVDDDITITMNKDDIDRNAEKVTQSKGVGGAKEKCILNLHDDGTIIKASSIGGIIFPSQVGKSEWTLGDSRDADVFGFKLGNVSSISCASKEMEREYATSGVYIRHEPGLKLSCDNVADEKLKGPIYKYGPFNMNRKCVADEVKLLDYVFASDLDIMEYMVETPDNYLTRGMLSCLNPGKFINGEVINIIVEYLTIKEKRSQTLGLGNWYLPTRMTADSIIVDTTVPEFIERHGIKEKFMGQLKTCKKILIPINRGQHWLLLVVLIEKKIVEIWDSLLHHEKSIGSEVVKEVMQTLDTVLSVEINGWKGKGWSFTNFSVKTRTDLPQQPNGFDCAVFMLNFMEENLKALQPDNYRSDNERARLVLRIVLSKLNRRFPAVLESARRHSKVESNQNVDHKRDGRASEMQTVERCVSGSKRDREEYMD